MSLNLIGGASGVCHFLAISGLALAWGRGGCAEARVPGIRGRVSEEQSPVLIQEARGDRRLLGVLPGRQRRSKQSLAILI